jgi:hypothetical protein
MRRIALLVFVMALAACAGTGRASPTPSPQALTVADGSGCAADHMQHLTVSAALTGTLSCSVPPATCTLKGHELYGAIHASSGSAPLLVSIFVSYQGVGQYPLGPASNSEIDVDGPARWRSSDGAITVVTVTATTIQGSVDSSLVSGQRGQIHLSGSWTCDVTQS